MIAIIDYNAGNTRSVQNALHRLGADSVVTHETDALRQAEKVIFPGVGHAESAMHHLREKGLGNLIPTLKQPVLGICLGLQLLCQHTEEGDTPCLGVFPTRVRKFPAQLRVPHMGWSELSRTDETCLLAGISLSDDFYYVHSYYAETCAYTVAECNYAVPFSAVLQKDNFFATQFHPEKSAGSGEKLLQNFLEL